MPKQGSPRTALNPLQEKIFRGWYAERAQLAGLDPDPDNPLHKYNYRGAFLAGAEPTISATDSLYHWPSAFKDADHPNRFVRGVGDTRAIDRGTDYRVLRQALLASRAPAVRPDNTRAPLAEAFRRRNPGRGR